MKLRIAKESTQAYKPSVIRRKPMGTASDPLPPEETYLSICGMVDDLEEQLMDVLSYTKLFLQIGDTDQLELQKQQWLEHLPALLEQMQVNLRDIPNG